MKFKPCIYKSYIALTFASLIIFSGCKTKSSELDAMLKSPIPTTQLATGHEVSRKYQDKSVTLGKPQQAEVTITYEPQNNYTKEDVYDEIVKILEENNWKKEEVYSITLPGYFRASLPQDGFSIVAEVIIYLDSNIVSIQLRAGAPH